jgi:hypothetical protein
LSKQIEINDDAAANEEEVEGQIEEDNVEKEARDNQTGVVAPIMRGNKQTESADNAMASEEEVKEQVEENRVNKEAFENGVSTASAESNIQRGCVHD